MDASTALSSIPNGLRTPLISEYNNILQNYLERRWSPSELSGGLFCEIVYTIIDGIANGTYPEKPSKPKSMIDACRALENQTSLPRSLRILVPRLLPSLYEVRNNRGVGHVGGDVNPNHMDSHMVVSQCSWIMAELIRVLHTISTDEAQNIVDKLVEFKTPLIWEGNGIKRVLNPKMSIKDQTLILIASHTGSLNIDILIKWLDYKNKQYFTKLLSQLHKKRYIEFDKKEKIVTILPPGSNYASGLFANSDI